MRPGNIPTYLHMHSHTSCSIVPTEEHGTPDWTSNDDHYSVENSIFGESNVSMKSRQQIQRVSAKPDYYLCTTNNHEIYFYGSDVLTTTLVFILKAATELNRVAWSILVDAANLSIYKS